MNKLHTIICLLVSTNVFLSCRTNVGTLNIRTYPVSGSVFVNGKPYGEAPVAISLKAGEYEISFSEYSDQYNIPPDQKIKIENGGSLEFTGIYENRFIPAKPPAGFSPADSIRIYGTSEGKLKDGTIFDYINGGGLVYLKHGLRETTHQVFQNAEGIKITVDIFDMGTRKNAQSAFSNEEICPQGFIACNIGTECKAYNYEPDFFLYFFKSKHLVYISTNDDSIRKVLELYAATINMNIAEEEQS